MVPASVIENKSTASREVRKLLLGGEVHPGQRLSHWSLAKDLGLSRSPVREALLQLEAEGIIEHRPQSGVYLREVSPKELGELYDIRELIEPYAAILAKRVAPTAKQHREIYEAIKKRDPVEAAKLMGSHISGMSKRVLADIGRR